MELRGLGVALITPFDERKQIDYPALERMIDHLLAGETDYIVVLGTTGETPALSAQEKNDIRRFVREQVSGRIPLVCGMGSNNTMALVDELQTTDLEGYEAVLSVTPFYNKPSQEGMYRHFSEVARNSPLPVILYNVPGRTGVNLSAKTTLRLANDHTNIIGIKEASGNFKQIEEIIHGKPSTFNVISGDDAITYPLLTLGAIGVISVVGNAFPKEFGKMVRLCLEGNYREALPIHTGFSRLYDELFVDGNPAGVKCLLNAMGLIRNELRLPLVPTRFETNEEIHAILRELRKNL
ncbi:MAG: 4-hydroxy-tetrahydrodipicolinate synthase [Muribaculaceae bacterium]|nr:4-hydroxy-tetrahydrodipicolinate synthase [Muribaculaceae bacterium]